MKSIFFTGKGGVGKSTLSACAAYQLSEQGFKVLAVSFDPAHNLGDIFDMNLGHRKKRLGNNLFLAEANLEQAAKKYIEQNTSILTQIYSYTKAFNLDLYFKVLRYSPGVEEYAALTALEEVFREETEFDYIVIDTPPTALTLRILALPGLTNIWIDRLRRIRREILKRRYTIHNIQGKYIEEGVVLPYEPEDDPVLQKLDELYERYEALNNLLKSADNYISVVFNPDYLSLRETERIIEGLKDLELPLKVAYNNKYTPELEKESAEVENALFKKNGNVTPIRVPLQEINREGAYKISFDLTQPFFNE